MSGWVDVHAHWVPDVDDGARGLDQAAELCEGLAALGYERLVATPHIRTAMFPNEPEGLRAAFEAAGSALRQRGVSARLELAAEHFFDDVLLERVASGRFLPYPGGRAFLVELPAEVLPELLARWFFQLAARGLRPVLAHPERYAFLWRRPERLAELAAAGCAPQLDLMSLVGRYGRRARAHAERFLDEGLYEVAGSDVHRPEDLPRLEEALQRLERLAGPGGARRLLRDGPLELLGGVA